MYKHIVLWKLKKEVNGLSKEELAVEVKRRLDELPALIPEIKGYETAINIGAYGASFFDVSLVKINSEAVAKTTMLTVIIVFFISDKAILILFQPQNY